MRFGIQRGEPVWRSQFWMDLNKTWQTCAKNCFLLTALLFSHMQSVSEDLIQFQKQKMAKNRQKLLRYAIGIFYIPVASMAISP